jgi:hypothetical protein
MEEHTDWRNSWKDNLMAGGRGRVTGNMKNVKSDRMIDST